MKIFLDTSFIVALVNDNDELHEKALQLKNRGILDQNDCYVSNLVISEVVTVVGNRLGSSISVLTYSLLLELCFLLNEYTNRNFNNDVMFIYEKYENKFSFVDCSIIELMEENNINNLISYDKEFRNVDNINVIN